MDRESLKRAFTGFIDWAKAELGNSAKTVAGIAESIGVISGEEIEFVIVPPAVLINLADITVKTAGLAPITWYYDTSWSILVIAESLPDTQSGYAVCLAIVEKLISALLENPPPQILEPTNPHAGFAFAGEGIVGMEITFEATIKNMTES